MRFEWDEAKNAANWRKHRLSFTQAMQVFRDPKRVLLSDRVVDGEERWHTIGWVKDSAVGIVQIIVVHTIRDELKSGIWSEAIRIISARRTTSREKRIYADENG